jgi:hypothetical protein
MRLDTVYAKTEKGLEEIKTRAYRVAQNFRLVLLQIDGRTTAGDVASRFSRPAIVEEAVDFLVSEHFITAAAPAPEVVTRRLSGDELIAALEPQLSIHLGPIAGLIVMERVTDPARMFTCDEALQIVDALATEIGALTERRAFQICVRRLLSL